MQEKHGFIYIWYDRKKKMYYIGSHWGLETDRYICSSRRMNAAHKRRPQDFKRRIIARLYTNKKDLLLLECLWLQQIPDKELGKKYYNHTKHLWSYWLGDKKSPMFGRNHTEETKQKMRGRVVSEETKQKLREYATKQYADPENRKKAGAANVGRKIVHSEETRRKIGLSNSIALKGNTPWNKGLKTGKGQIEHRTKL